MKKIYFIIVLLFVSLARAYSEDVVKDSTSCAAQVASDVADLLRGRIAGVRVSSIDGNPLGATNINIRGINSFRSDNQPLWIVDGAMLSTDLNQNIDAFWQFGEQSYTTQLNPFAFLDANMIESIEVIKDISATAIYGNKGANGVIVVKTRMPADGENGIDIRTNFGFAGQNLVHNHLVSCNFSNDKTQFNLSGSYRHNAGTVSRNISDYGSVKANFDTKSNSVLWFNFNLILSAGKSSSPSGVAYLGRPSMLLAMRDPALSPGTTVDQWLSDYDDDTKDYRAVFSSQVQVNISPSLHIRVKGGLDYQNNQRVIWYGRQTRFGAPSVENEFGGRASNIFSSLLSYNADASLNFSRFISENHFVKAEAGAQILGNLNEFNTQNGFNFVLDQKRGKGLATGAYPVQHHKYSHSGSSLGIYADLSYRFKDIAGANATLRWDNNFRYLGNESHIYPSAELWARFFCFKVSAGWGKSGLNKYIPYNLFGRYLQSGWYEPENGTSVFFDGLDRLTTDEWHIGLEASFLDHRLNASVVWFDRSTQDSFLMYKLGNPTGNVMSIDGKEIPIWSSGGCEKMYERHNTIRNRGFEFAVDADIIRNDDWKWTVSVNTAINENRVAEINASDIQGRKVGQGIYANFNAVGRSASSLYGYLTNADGSLKDKTGDGRINEYDKVFLGETIPTVYGGVQTAVRFRRLCLELIADGAAGHNVANIQNIVKDNLKDESGNICICEKYVERADFLRLSRVSISYDLPLKAKWIKGLCIKASGSNLAVISGYSGYNPDVNCFANGAMSNGLDYGSYPLCRVFMFGVSAKF